MPLSTESMLERLALLIPALFSLTLHEYAHARTALAFGDPTARDQGRVTMNPLAHLDPIGTLCLVLTGMFGWARPVPVNPHNLRPPRLGDVAVSLAGPLSNLFLAVVTGLLLRLFWAVDRFLPAGTPQQPIERFLLTFLSLNVVLCVFNLLPLFPLDGHHVAREMLTGNRRIRFMEWQVRYGSILLMALIFAPPILNLILPPPILERVFGPRATIPNPLAWVFRHAQSLAVRILLLW